MLEALLVIWIFLALLIVWEQRIIRIVIYLGVFSLIPAACYLLLGSPDVAMAEAAATAFVTVFFIVCLEKHFGLNYIRKDRRSADKAPNPVRNRFKFKQHGLPLILAVSMLFLFIYYIPDCNANSFLKNQYITRFMSDVEGKNVVTAIYLGYRVYDTLFEALVLIISVTAVTHLSAFDDSDVKERKRVELEKSGMAVYTMRIISPILLLFGVYIIANGHISPGGGFQGGLAISSFYICRYMIYSIHDLSVAKLNRLEDLVFTGITLIAVSVIFLGDVVDFMKTNGVLYLTVMNAFIGLKVACGFTILFYRYVAVERE
ncbi:MAG: DUF4040 domain-containing protein [Defluviitaleaceae bacterium]|nr:DUF4040 domain-containing protein [Defluviitaleaceae bacterium]